jgi:Domain of unknown function DUF29
VPPSETALYRRDLYSWALQQAAALRAGNLEHLDLLNLAEEIEDVGSEQLHKLTSAYRIVLLHMLKWDHQPGRRSRRWITSIESLRAEAEDVLEDSPGLQSRQDVALARAYRRARMEAAGETGLDKRLFPSTCPYSPEEVMTRSFVWPSSEDTGRSRS